MLSVIIPTRGDRQSLFRCIESCVSQEIGEEKLEIIVIFDRPSMQNFLLAKERSAGNVLVRVFQSSGQGVNAARNRGIAEANGDFLYFLDDDCRLPSTTHLKRVREFFESHPEIDAAGGLYSNSESASWSVRCYNFQVRLWIEAGLGALARNLVGGNVCYRRRVFQTGLRFNPESCIGGDETEFHRRLLTAGFQLGLFRGLPVIHDADSSLKTAAFRAWISGIQAGMNDLSTKLSTACFLKVMALLFSNPSYFPYFVVYRTIMLFGRTWAMITPMLASRSNEHLG